MIFLITYNLQCAMCRAVLESGVDQKAAESLNDGIVYLMIIPYVLGFLTLVFLYYRFFRKSHNSIFFFIFATMYNKVLCIILNY